MKFQFKAQPPASWRAIFLAAALSVIPVAGMAEDSAAGDAKLAQAMDALSRGTLAAAREAVDALAEAARARPAHPLYEKLRGEIEILFRAEHAIPQSQEATAQANMAAELKLRSMKLALEPSKLTGRNDPVAAERYRLQAEELIEDAKAGEARAKRNFLLALQRADALAIDMLDDGEEAIAHGLGSALLVIAERNAEYLTADDGSLTVPTLTKSRLDDLIIRVKVRQTWVTQGLEKEKAGDRAGAIELFQKAEYKEGILRLGGGGAQKPE